MLGKQKAKYIQSLGHKKVRDEEGVFVAEGVKIVDELLHTNKQLISHLYAEEEWIASHDAILSGIDYTSVTTDELSKISQLSTPNKVLAIVKKIPLQKIQTKRQLLLGLDTIQDPGNLGTIIRIADWFGIKNIICSAECADVYNPKTIQSTMGSFLRVNLLYTNLAEWLSGNKDLKVYAALLDGQDVGAMKKINEGMIIIGNESKGISDMILERVNIKITIPKKGNAESLNAAVAAGIILSHLS